MDAPPGDAERSTRATLGLIEQADHRFARSSLDARSVANDLAVLAVGGGALACSAFILAGGVLKTLACVRANGPRGVPSDECPTDSHDDRLSCVRTGQRKILERAEGSVALLPLLARGTVLGVLEVEARSLTRDDLALLEILCHRAAAALDRTHLLRATEEALWAAELQAEYAKRLQSVTCALSEALTTHQMGAIVVRQAIDAMGGHVAGVVQVSEDGATLRTVAGAGTEQAAMGSYALSDPLPVTLAFRERRELFFESAADWTSAYPGVDDGLLEGVFALACLPLTVAGGSTIGVLFLGFAHPHRFLDVERALLRTLAQQLAQVLDRARLFESEHRTRLAAEELNRAKDEFLGVVSHELRTPLTAILGWARVLRDVRSDAEKRELALGAIERNGLAQKRIIEDLLDESRIVTGKLRLELHATDFTEVVRAAIDVVRPAAEAKGVDLRVHIGRVPMVAGDAERLQQIAWNLLSNAIRFTPRGRSVAVDVERVGTDVCLVVSDEGMGIAASFLPFVFDRFRQGDGSATRRHGGLGLGLAIVRHLVELHGGSVSAQSDGPERGAVFTVRLPVPTVAPIAHPTAASRPTRPDEPHGGQAVPLHDLRVLLVEDDSDTRGAFVELLHSYHAVVRSVDSADAAVQVLDEFNPDVLLSDIGLPGEDGFALLARVRSLSSPNANVPAVALTAFAGESDIRRAHDAGFFAHLAKPVDARKLSMTLAMAARQASSAAQSVADALPDAEQLHGGRDQPS
jgi:signal transduction histidine kinase/FixJ family two-component response regulator